MPFAKVAVSESRVRSTITVLGKPSGAWGEVGGVEDRRDEVEIVAGAGPLEFVHGR